MKQKIGLFLGGLVVGACIIFVLLTWAQYSGCSIDLKLALSPSLQLDCAGAPHQIAINFGSRPSRQSLKDALAIIAEHTQGRGLARVWVDDSVLQNQIAATPIDPPAGPQPSLSVVQQLLAQTQAGDSIGICLVPQGGYRVRTLK